MASNAEMYQSGPIVVATPKAVHDLPGGVISVRVDPDGLHEFSESIGVGVLPAQSLATIIRAWRFSPLNRDVTLEEASDELICTRLSEPPVAGERSFVSLGMLRGRRAQFVEPMIKRSDWGASGADAEAALSRALADHLLSGQIAASPGPQRVARETASGLGRIGSSLFRARAIGFEPKVEAAGELRPYRVVRGAVDTVPLLAAR